jgi:hypothetical protein
MKRTTGAEATALSIAVRTSCDRRRVWRRWCDIRGWREEAVAEGRRAVTAPRRACDGLLAKGRINGRQYQIRTGKRSDLDSIAMSCNCAEGTIVHRADRRGCGETFLIRDDVILFLRGRGGVRIFCGRKRSMIERGYYQISPAHSLSYRKTKLVEKPYCYCLDGKLTTILR